MVDQAKWRYAVGRITSRNPKYERRRLIFYLNVLKFQLEEEGFKRVYVDTRYLNPRLNVFCGSKKNEIFKEEVKQIEWSIGLKKERSHKEWVKERVSRQYKYRMLG